LGEVLHSVGVGRVGGAQAEDGGRAALHHGDPIRDIARAVASSLGLDVRCSVAVGVQHQVA
jgi:hypothetical protein